MFKECEKQIWSVSNPEKVRIIEDAYGATCGMCKKILFGLSSRNESVTVSFDPVDGSAYEEITFYLACRDSFDIELIEVAVGGVNYTFKNNGTGYAHIIIPIDHRGMIAEITFTSLTYSAVILIDCLGFRKVNYDTMDYDIVNALREHISLDYNVRTELVHDVHTGDKAVTFKHTRHIFDTSLIEIRDGTHSQTVRLTSQDEGTLKKPLEYNFSKGTEVKVLCPVLLEDYEDIQPDPVCGIVITDMTSTERRYVTVRTVNGDRTKRMLGSIGITIYIDCTSKKKVIELARQFECTYGKEFRFLLDGELVTIYAEHSTFLDDEIGNNPRMAYFYRLEPQPLTIAMQKKIEVFDIHVESSAMEAAHEIS